MVSLEATPGMARSLACSSTMAFESAKAALGSAAAMAGGPVWPGMVSASSVSELEATPAMARSFGSAKAALGSVAAVAGGPVASVPVCPGMAGHFGSGMQGFGWGMANFGAGMVACGLGSGIFGLAVVGGGMGGGMATFVVL